MWPRTRGDAATSSGRGLLACASGRGALAWYLHKGRVGVLDPTPPTITLENEVGGGFLVQEESPSPPSSGGFIGGLGIIRRAIPVGQGRTSDGVRHRRGCCVGDRGIAGYGRASTVTCFCLVRLCWVNRGGCGLREAGVRTQTDAFMAPPWGTEPVHVRGTSPGVGSAILCHIISPPLKEAMARRRTEGIRGVALIGKWWFSPRFVIEAHVRGE